MKEELLQRLKKEYSKSDERIRISTLIYDRLGEIEEKDTNKIYVYCGAVKKVGDDIQVVESIDASNILYWNIEQSHMIDIPIEEREEFEANNIVLTGEHHKIMLDFFTESIKTNQEDAVKKILKKYKK